MQQQKNEHASTFDVDKATLIVALQKTRVFKPGALYRSESGTFHYLLRDGGVPPYTLTVDQAKRISATSCTCQIF